MLRFSIGADSDGHPMITVNQRRAWAGAGAFAQQKRPFGGDEGGPASKRWRSGSRGGAAGGDRRWQADRGDRGRGWSPGGLRPKDEEEDQGGRGRWRARSQQQQEAEKVQRWVGYVLKRGHSDFGIVVESAGWVRLCDLVGVMRQRKPDFGIEDAAGLRHLLVETDAAGRFDVSGDRVRMVERGQRVERGLRRAPERAEWPTSVKQEEAPDEDSPWGREAPAASRDGASTVPSPPPGPHWTTYRDSDVLWFYYDGPLGRWWTENEDGRPKRWTETDG